MRRRGFLAGTGKFAVGTMTAVAMLDGLSPRYAQAQQVAPDDDRIVTELVEYASPAGAGAMRGYLARPATDGRKPAVLVVHENRGLNPYVEDVVRRLAVADFLAFAPDALFPLGGYPGNDDEGRTLQRQRDRDEMVEDFAAAEEVAQIEAPLLIQYAGLDERVNAGWPAYMEALDAHGKTYTVHIYDNVNHGFHNDTTPRFDPAAAKLAEDRTVAFFNEHLR